MSKARRWGPAVVARVALVLGILLSGCLRAHALDPRLDLTQYAHTSWKSSDGFPAGAITSIAQTPDGYLWLGTEFGLVRFDGVRHVSWQPPVPQRLPSNNIRELLASRDGTLWIGTFNGLASWKDGRLVNYAELAGQRVQSLVESRDGTVWAGGALRAGSARIATLCTIQRGRIGCSTEDAFGGGIWTMYEDSEANLWAAVDNGVWRWRPGPPTFYSFPGGAETKGLVEPARGELVCATLGGLRRIAAGKIDAYSIPGNVSPERPEQLLLDRDGGLWIGTRAQGLVHVHNGRTDVFKALDGLSNDTPYRLFEDREGSIWVGTLGGLDRFRELAVSPISQRQGLSADLVSSVQGTPDGSVLVATARGLDWWKDGEIAHIPRSPNVQSLFFGSGRMWASTPGGLNRVDGTRLIPMQGIPTGDSHSIVEDAGGNLWIANRQQGLLRVSPPAYVVQQIPWPRLGRDGPALQLVTDDVHGGLWLGYPQGGIAYFSDGRIRASYAAADGLGKGIVNGFRMDVDGTLWVVTEGGLSRVKDGHLATLTGANGLPCDTGHWMIRDDAGSVWLHMACGLVRVSESDLATWIRDPKKTIHATVFDGSDGVRLYSFSPSGYSPVVAKTSDGRLWFATAGGVGIIDPRRLPFNKLPPPVHVEQIIADRNVVKSDEAGDARLPALTRDLQIEYTALSLVAPEKNQFRYKLEGYDRDWQDAGTRRQVFYTNLPPRSYRFRVIASNNSGVWNETGASLDFSIAPAYYQTTWFAVVSIVGTLVLFFALYRWRVRQVAYAYESRLQERVNERTRIARELHDTLLQSFHGLLFRLQAVANMLPEPSGTRATLDAVIDQAAQAITEGRDAVQNLRASTVVTNDLADAISTLGEELLADHRHRSTSPPPALEVIVEGTSRDLHPIIRDDAYRIAGEALRNAFRHARAHRIVVTIAYDDDRVQLRVRDDGQGIDPALGQDARPGHFGLPGMRERAELVGGKVAFWSERDAGTEVELTIPAPIAYAKADAPRRSAGAGR
jgi:signal transduction histidine kinase/ligand-binding sensor domain-containing protein